MALHWKGIILVFFVISYNQYAICRITRINRYQKTSMPMFRYQYMISFVGYPDPFTDPGHAPTQEAGGCLPGGSRCGSSEETFPPTSPMTTQHVHQQFLLQQQLLVTTLQHMHIDFESTSQPASLCHVVPGRGSCPASPPSPLAYQPIVNEANGQYAVSSGEGGVCAAPDEEESPVPPERTTSLQRRHQTDPTLAVR